MHRCLTVQEILSNIFNLIYPEVSDSHIPHHQKLKCFAYLARTCKTFYEPAITILWSHQTSIVPLVRCLPGDAYAETNEYGISTLQFSRELSLPSDFDRVKLYAQNIKSLHTVDFPDCRLSFQAFALLLLHIPESGTLLPNLCHLELFARDFDDLAIYPRLVVGQRLESVCITLGQYQRYHGSSWDNVQTVLLPYAPRLKSFTVHDDEWRVPNSEDEDLSIHLIPLYSDFRDLVILKTRFVKLGNDALTHISTLPILQTLNLNLCDVDFSLTSELTFDQLTNLELETTNLEDVKKFLSFVSFKNLQVIVIKRDWREYFNVQWNFETFSAVLCHRHRDCPLASIVLCIPRVCLKMGHIHKIALCRADIQPLLVFPHLSSFTVDHCSTFLLDDAILMEMSRAWPKLQNLHLEDIIHNEDEGRPQFTTAGVISFARSCPDLESLTLCFDAEKTPKYAHYNALSSTPQVSHLNTLNVCNSPANGSRRIVQSLILAFPKLHNFCFNHDETDEWEEDVWEEVNSLLDPVMKMRRPY